jgi:hypothetical protein
VQVIGSPDDLQRELRLELGRGPGDELSSVAAVGRAEITAADRDGAEGLAGIVPQVREPGAQAEVDFGDVTVKRGGQLSRCFLFAFRLSCSGKGARSPIKPPMASPKAGRRCDRIMAGYPVQRRRPPTITWEAARRRLRDSGTLSGTSAKEEQMTGKIMPRRERDTSTIQAAADAFLSSPRYTNPNTRRGYTGVLDRLLVGLGVSRPLAEVSGEELAGLLEQLWGQRAPATWNRNRGAVAAWLSWCAANRLPAPLMSCFLAPQIRRLGIHVVGCPLRRRRLH